MDGNFYVDSRTPFISGDVAAVTVVGTNKALVPVANLPILGSNYFSYIGKAVRIKMFGRMSTAATPGTMTISFLWGTGADANGTTIMSSPAFIPIASLVNTSWTLEAIIRCRTMGAAGTLFGTGIFHYLNSLTATAVISDHLLPPTAAAASGSVDLTAANVISPQILATTSTTNTMQVHDFSQESLN